MSEKRYPVEILSAGVFFSVPRCQVFKFLAEGTFLSLQLSGDG
jgi:hypothetical protein